MNIACKTIILCFVLLLCAGRLFAQSDSAIQNLPTDTLRKDTMYLSPEESRKLNQAISNPGWHLFSHLLQFFNVGAYYSYLTPIGSFKKEVPAISVFSFDVALDLTSVLNRAEYPLHWFIGMNVDYSNFGKTKSPYTKSVGDTTYKVNIKSNVDVYSYYIEAEYRRSFICPFASIALSNIYLNPTKEVTTSIHNATTNSNYTEGEVMTMKRTRGVNMVAGLKFKYRFNDHKELMLLTKVSYLRSNPIQMIDLESVTFSPTGAFNYETYSVRPSWLMYSLGIKYNF